MGSCLALDFAPVTAAAISGLAPSLRASFSGGKRGCFDGNRPPHPRHSAIQRRRLGHPGQMGWQCIFQYYSVAEDELAKGYAGQYGSAQETADAIAVAWEKITDQIGRESQIKLYKAALGL